MATQKPISTISYNTEAFLKEKLESWIDAHIIQCYMYICHKGEDGDKDHIHVRIEPNKKLDKMTLTEELREYPFGCTKPLGVRPWHDSKEEDWILYAVHEPNYLKLKYGGGEEREKLPYSKEDIKANEMFDVDIAYTRALASMKHSTVNMASRMQSGQKPIDMILEGENPYMVNALMRAISTNDYSRLQDEYSKLESRYNMLMEAIDNAGFAILSDGDSLKLERIEVSEDGK